MRDKIDTAIQMIREFISTYRMYRKAHTRGYAARSAWRIAMQGMPF